jgi:antitoxin CcdA
VLGHDVGERLAVPPAIVLGHGEAHRLQLDPPGPALAQLGEHRPGDLGLRRDRIEMGADRHRAVRMSAAQGELHPCLDILRRPVGPPVTLHGLECLPEAAVRVGGARPDVALVEMGVHVDEAGQDQPAGEIGGAGRRCARAGPHGGDPPVGEVDVDEGQLTVTKRRVKKAARYVRARQAADSGLIRICYVHSLCAGLVETTMSRASSQPAGHRRPVNLSLPGALVEEAKALEVNLSQAAEAGVAAAVRAAREARWHAENREAIAEYNALVDAGFFDEFLQKF